MDRRSVGGELGLRFASGLLGAQRFGDRGSTLACGGGSIVILEEHGSESPAHVPLDVVGEHADEDVSPDAIGEVMDRALLEVAGLETADGTLHVTQSLVGRTASAGLSLAGETLVRIT
jgi:hypothetical protein